MKLEIKTAKQTSVVTEKEVFYLIIGEGEHKTIINVGDKTYNKVNLLISELLNENLSSKPITPKK